MLRATCGDLDTTGVVGLSRSLHDACYLAELASHLVDHLGSSAPDSLHAHGAEEERHHGTNEETAKEHRVEEREIVGSHEVAY